MRRVVGTTVGLALVMMLAGGVAAAQVPGPPPSDPSWLARLDPEPGPLPGVTPRTACVGPLPGGSGAEPPWVVDQLRLADAWRAGRGAGQTVAVIDTGVAPHPLLAGRLIDGGDFVGPGDTALADCDGHGTLVAGLVAGAEDPATGFAGVAPEARVLAIRQNSATVSVAGRDRAGAGDVVTLARAILRAVEQRATVISISGAACLPAAVAPAVTAPLRAAVREAVDRDVVVVAAAGNAGSGACVQSSGAAGPGAQVVAPAWFADDVLSVGYTGRDGRPAARTIRGPWVSLAAPGTDVVSLAPAGPGLVDRSAPAASALDGGETGAPIEGSSFAAPLVAGVAALVRARHPELSAREVAAHLVATAAPPGGVDGQDRDAVGAGVLDPVAALDAPVGTGRPDGDETDVGGGPARLDLGAPGDADSVSRAVAVTGSVGAVLVGGTVLGTVSAVRRARRER